MLPLSLTVNRTRHALVYPQKPYPKSPVKLLDVNKPYLKSPVKSLDVNERLIIPTITDVVRIIALYKDEISRLKEDNSSRDRQITKLGSDIRAIAKR